MADEKTSVEFTWQELAYVSAALSKTAKQAAAAGADREDVELLTRLFDRVIKAGHAIKVPDNARELILQAKERAKREV